MSRELFGLELGLRITNENEQDGISIIRSTAAPGGDAGQQDAASVGSMALTDAGELYMKDTAGTGADKWVRMSTGDDLLNLSWRSEVVRALTDDALSAGNTDPTTWTDNESGTDHTAFAIGEFVLSDVDGTPALFEVTGISAPNITLAAAADPLADNDAFVIRKWFPDSPAAQENQALGVYNGSVVLKLADVDWNFADGINLASGYTPGSGDISSADTVQSAIEKLDGNVDALTSAVGVSQGDSDMGTYTGTLLNDNESSKQNIQQLETEAQALRSSIGGSIGDSDMGTYTGSIISDNVDQRTVNQELETYLESLAVPVTGEVNNITTLQDIDTVVVDDVDHAEWEIVAFEEATPGNKIFQKISALHDGTASADATNVDDSVHTKLKLGSNFNLSVSVDLNGAAGSQVMRLRAASSTAGVTIKFRRSNVL